MSLISKIHHEHAAIKHIESIDSVEEINAFISGEDRKAVISAAELAIEVIEEAVDPDEGDGTESPYEEDESDEPSKDTTNTPPVLEKEVVEEAVDTPEGEGIEGMSGEGLLPDSTQSLVAVPSCSMKLSPFSIR